MQTQPVRGARGFEPFFARNLVIADHPPHAIAENLRASAGQRIHAGIAQALQHLARRNLRPLRQISDLHHGEGLEVHLRKTLLQAAQHLAVPVERQLGMQTAHDVEFGDGFGPTLARDTPNLIERHGVRFRVFGSLSEGAQPATGYAHVGGIDVPVDVEIGGRAMQTLAHQIPHVP